MQYRFVFVEPSELARGRPDAFGEVGKRGFRLSCTGPNDTRPALIWERADQVESHPKARNASYHAAQRFDQRRDVLGIDETQKRKRHMQLFGSLEAAGHTARRKLANCMQHCFACRAVERKPDKETLMF